MAKKRKNNVQKNRNSVPNTCKVSNWLLHSNTPDPSIFGPTLRPRTFFTIGENSLTAPVVNQRPRTFFTIGAPRANNGNFSKTTIDRPQPRPVPNWSPDVLGLLRPPMIGPHNSLRKSNPAILRKKS